MGTPAPQLRMSPPRQVTVTLTDGHGGESVSTVTVNVEGANDAPVITSNAGNSAGGACQ